MTSRPDELLERAVLALSSRLQGEEVDVLVTLGSGLGGVADAFEDTVEIPTAAIPGLAVSRVPGHSGTLRFGRVAGRNVLAQVGRIHLYEGHRAADVTRVVDVAAALGATTFLVTNAAGGIDPTFTPGDVMVMTDHLNLTGTSPLVGVMRDGAPVFLDMSAPYDADLRALAHELAGRHGVSLRDGVYAGLLGPAYETPAEIAMFRTLGAQAVGMSTVLEVIAARSHGMRVLGLSTITNVHGAGIETTHAEVIEVGARVAAGVAAIVSGVLEHLPA